MDEFDIGSKGFGEGVGEWRKRGAWTWVGEGIGDVAKGSSDDLDCGTVGHLDLCWEPGEGVADADGAGFVDPNFVAAIGFEGGSDVPPIKSMWCPCFAVCGFFMGDDSTTNRSKGCSVEVEVAMDLCMSR